MTIAIILTLVAANGVLVVALCRAVAAGERTVVVPDEPAHSGDHLDVYLRLDGMTAAVNTAIGQLAKGQVADAQVTLGEAASIERVAQVEEWLHLVAVGLSTPSEREDEPNG